jgi:hypothetical protein
MSQVKEALGEPEFIAFQQPKWSKRRYKHLPATQNPLNELIANAADAQLGRREQILRTVDVLELFPQVKRATLHRWIKNRVILEPAVNPQTLERVWTRVEIHSLFKHLVAKGLLSEKVI